MTNTSISREIVLRQFSPHNRSGRGTLRTQYASTGLIQGIINPIIARTELLITKGDNQSFCKFPSGLGIEELRFTVPVFSKNVLMFSIEEYPNNIRSSDFALSFVNASPTFHHGAMQLICRFEENGNEIAGTFQAHLRNMSLTLTVGLAMEGEAISYDSAEAKLDFDLDVVGVPDSLLDPVFGYTDKLRHQIEQDLAAMVTRPEIRSRISRAATEKISMILPAGANIYTVKVSRDALFLKYWQ